MSLPRDDAKRGTVPVIARCRRVQDLLVPNKQLEWQRIPSISDSKLCQRVEDRRNVTAGYSLKGAEVIHV